MNGSKTLFVMGAFLLIMQGSLLAIKVQLPNPNLEPQGAESNISMFVVNDSKQMKAVEVSVQSRAYDALGKETNVDLSNEFEFFPAQIILKPNQEQVVTIHYVGDKNIAIEKAIRVNVEELPVGLDKFSSEKKDAKTSNLAVMMKFVKAAYVVPKDVDYKVLLNSVSMEKSESGTTNMVIEIENIGGKHAIIAGLELSFAGVQDKLKLETKDIPGPNVLAKEKRKIILPWPSFLPQGPVKAEMKVTI